MSSSKTPSDPDSPLLRRSADFDPFSDHRITPQHYYLLEKIGEAFPLDEIHSLGTAGVDTLLAELQAWGAIVLDGDHNESDSSVAIHDETELEDLENTEVRMLAEDVELESWEKKRLIAVKRKLDAGRILAILGIKETANKRELRRAYFELAKEFHPDRYYGKRLGSFGPLLGEVFASATQAVKALSDSRTTTSSQVAKKSRRKSRRLAFRGRVDARAQSWDSGYQCSTSDLSRGGLFVVTERSAMAGEAIIVELTTKQGPLRLRGTVAWCRPVAEAERTGMNPGIGVRLDVMSDEDAASWRAVLDKVEKLQPEPEPKPLEPGHLARGTGSFRRAPVIGIDLGTTYTSVCATINNRVCLLPWPDGSLAIPSVIAFPAPGRHLVGEAARDRLLTDPRHTIASAKRLLGRKADDTAIASHLARAAYDTHTGPDGYILAEFWNEPYHIAQLCSYLLRAARDAAERALDTEVREAVLAVPTSFTPPRMDMLRRAAKLAQLELVDIIEEPNAAALANRSYPDFGGLVGIYDFGGGTFDFSIIDASHGDFRVMATTGDSWLGGDDLDLEMADALANLVEKERGIDLRSREVEWQRLLFSCEQAKCELSTAYDAFVIVEEYMHSADGPLDLRIKVNRQQAEGLWAPAIDRTIATADQALNLLGLRPSDLSQIYLSGGSTYVPAVRQAIANRFQIPVRSLVPPEYAVCLGAGVQAATIEKRRPLVKQA
ncbi:MAG: Hsp70 family protein [Deltaproteobacteria bacterium]|nr:Hsp70 family protein [Deltaproteobacteria bacterium]